MIDLDALAADLKKAKLVDRGRLKPGGRKEVEAEIDQLDHDRGLHAHVVVLLLSDDPAEAKPVWDRLAYDERTELLLISNGKAWEVRGWGLTRAQIDAAMADSAPAYKAYLGKGLVASLTALAGKVAAVAAPPPPRAPDRPTAPRSQPPTESIAPSSGTPTRSTGATFPWLPLGIGGAVAIGAVAFAIHRRNRRATESRGDFDRARASAERAYADLVLACEDLGGDAGTQLQLKASDLKKRLDDVIADADGKPDKMSDRVVLGKIAQLDSELAALRSTQLQKAQKARG
ncbi:MAG TPA: hypothetical protein VMJ10_12085 [Kofleriaceae bacterium]|nr:hypothetical protein [Kofleriaceae bacterium]